MSNRLPMINATGVWELKAPFDTLISKTSRYTCVSVTKLEKLETQGEDPEKVYYTPHHLDNATYQLDLVNQVCIITIRSESGVLKSFPSSYLKSFPMGNGIEYAVIGLAISLGPLPVDTDLTMVKDKVKSVVKESIGVESVVMSQLLSETEVMSFETHETLNSARKLLITESNTDTAKIKRLEEEIQQERAKRIALEEKLIALANP